MIEYVGAAQTVFATSLRKACSIVISYILFPKPLIPQHVIGAGLVCIALYWNSKVCACARIHTYVYLVYIFD